MGRYSAGRRAKDSRSIEAIALQPNIDPYGEKFTTATDSAMAARMFEMVDTLLDPQVRLIAAPETYLSQYKQVDSPGLYPVFDTLRAFSARNGGLTVVTGSSFVRYFYDESSVTPTANRSRYGDFWYDVYNSAVQIDTQGMDRYEKSKLVPGVECFPFRSVLEGVLGDIMIDMGGMAGSNVTQDDREVFVSQGGTMRLAPIICYEALFGEFVAGYVRKGANALCVITNDGWWGNTEGPSADALDRSSAGHRDTPSRDPLGQYGRIGFPDPRRTDHGGDPLRTAGGAAGDAGACRAGADLLCPPWGLHPPGGGMGGCGVVAFFCASRQEETIKILY